MKNENYLRLLCSCSIAVYKALYKSFGGFAADVVAAIDQVKSQLFPFLGCRKLRVTFPFQDNQCTKFHQSKQVVLLTVIVFTGSSGRSRHYKFVNNTQQASSRNCNFLQSNRHGFALSRKSRHFCCASCWQYRTVPQEYLFLQSMDLHHWCRRP